MRVKAAQTKRGNWWQAVTWVLLLAFSLQSYVTQTHIHGTAGQAGTSSIVKLPGASSHKKLPDENGAADCPLCQAIVHAGAFFTPASPALLPPAEWVQVVLLPLEKAATAPHTAWHWQSRAPPQR